MAETTLNINQQYGNSDSAGTYRVLTAVSASSIPEGEYIYFKAVFELPDGTTIKRTIKDGAGETVSLTAIDDMVVLDYNFLNIEAVYNGDTMPSDLKIYEF